MERKEFNERSGNKTSNNKTPNVIKRPKQNAKLQNANFTKRPVLNNVQCNKTSNVTNRPMLQNAQCYKTPNVTKRPMLQNAQLQNVQRYNKYVQKRQ